MKTYRWTEEQKKALRGSIRKWQRIVNGTGIDDGTENCACCKKWNHHGNRCVGCPIFQFTGRRGCEGTPYNLNYHGEDIDKDISELNFLRAVYLAGGGK